MSEYARPGRPEGPGRREVRSYARRGSRLTPRQAAAWERFAGRWVIPQQALTDPGFSLVDHFRREAPLVVEIGSGVGEATVELAASRPAYDVLALEVWHPGVASTLASLGERGVSNVRLCAVDAVWALQHIVSADSLAGLWTFFPDPWPKKRHRKRRLITAEFARLAASRLTRGSEWRLATDWVDYADEMLQVLDAEPRLAGGFVDRWVERPVTRFERKGIAAGRTTNDLRYVRV